MKNGKIKTCMIHGLLRDLCIKESQKEQFYCAPRVQKIIGCGTMCFLCSSEEARERIDLPRLVPPSQQISLASCLVCDVCRVKYPQLNRIRLVKLLDPIDGDILHPNKLRYLQYLYNSRNLRLVGNLIHPLWNLQTLVIQFHDLILPSEIWKLLQLRHLKFPNAVLLDPTLITEVYREDSTVILKNLQTLSCIENFRWSEDAIVRIPNLRTLEINFSSNSNIEWSYYSFRHLQRLHKLESLSLAAEAPLTVEDIAFPRLLKKLTLLNCSIPWKEMTIIGSLPKLEVLKLHCNAFKGREWTPIEGEFRQLKKLTIWENDLECWRAEKHHFPCLEHLKLVQIYLKEIPLEIGEIVSLRSIQLVSWCASVVKSAEKILKEQCDIGNEEFQLYVDYNLVPPVAD